MDQLVEKYAAIPPSQRYMGIAIIAFGLIALHYYFVYDGQQADLATYQKKYETKVGEQDAKRQIAANLSSYQDKLAGTQRELEEARAKLPDSADVPQLLAQLGSHAELVGLSIEEFKPGKESRKDFVAEIPFDLAVKGSFHEIAMFIDSVSKLDRIVNVKELKMERPQSKESKVIVDGRFKLVAYRFVRETTAKKKKKKKK